MPLPRTLLAVALLAASANPSPAQKDQLAKSVDARAGECWDLAQKIWGWAETPVIVFSICVGLILGFGWIGFFWMGAIRLVYSLHMQCLVNSLTHLKRVEEGDSSMNVWWLGPFQLTAWGENWHQNHHTHAGSARLGLRWYQTDIGWYFIWMLEAVGLAHSVKRPRAS